MSDHEVRILSVVCERPYQCSSAAFQTVKCTQFNFHKPFSYSIEHIHSGRVAFDLPFDTHSVSSGYWLSLTDSHVLTANVELKASTSLPSDLIHFFSYLHVKTTFSILMLKSS